MSVSTTDVLKILREYPELRASVARCCVVQKIVSVPLVAVIHNRAQARFSTEAEVFVDELAHGHGLSRGNPVLALRERLFGARKVRGERLAEGMVHALTIKAWNAVALGRTLGVVRYLPGEEFPHLAE